FDVVPQRGTTFNDRLTHAWADTGGPGLQIGMDTPQVTSSELDGLLTRLDEGPSCSAHRPAVPRPAVLGHALDGGWWLIGWRRARWPKGRPARAWPGRWPKGRTARRSPERRPDGSDGGAHRAGRSPGGRRHGPPARPAALAFRSEPPGGGASGRRGRSRPRRG